MADGFFTLRPAAAQLVHVLLPDPVGRVRRVGSTTTPSSTGCGPTGRPASTGPGTWPGSRSRIGTPEKLAAAIGYYRAMFSGPPEPTDGGRGPGGRAGPQRHNPRCIFTAPTTGAWAWTPSGRRRSVARVGAGDGGGGRSLPPGRATRRGERPHPRASSADLRPSAASCSGHGQLDQPRTGGVGRPLRPPARMPPGGLGAPGRRATRTGGQADRGHRSGPERGDQAPAALAVGTGERDLGPDTPAEPRAGSGSARPAAAHRHRRPRAAMAGRSAGPAQTSGPHVEQGLAEQPAPAGGTMASARPGPRRR